VNGSPGLNRGHTLATSRLAALLLLPFVAVASWFGVGLLLTRPSPDCMEYCDLAGGGRLWLVIAGLGFVLIAGIWRRHYFFVAIGLCLCMVALCILVALDVVLLANYKSLRWPDGWYFLGSTAFIATVAAHLSWTLMLPDVAVRLPSPTQGTGRDPGT
jgi:hypothetical protein